jgi:uncharacterized Zn-finger protein
MPRAFDSDSDPQVLTFTENVECPFCGEIFEGEFVDHTKSLSVQDMVVAPTGKHECPECGRTFTASMSGWMFYGEAG